MKERELDFETCSLKMSHAPCFATCKRAVVCAYSRLCGCRGLWHEEVFSCWTWCSGFWCCSGAKPKKEARRTEKEALVTKGFGAPKSEAPAKGFGAPAAKQTRGRNKKGSTKKPVKSADELLWERQRKQLIEQREQELAQYRTYLAGLQRMFVSAHSLANACP